MCKIGKVYVIGLGPGAEKEMTYQASTALEKSEVIIGYTVYTGLIRERFPDKKYLSTPMRQEVIRCEMAMDEAMKGSTVAMVCSGDAGIYGMAGLLYEMGQGYPEVELEVVPGITAANGGAAVLGAPLMHDFAVISLSDLLTPWEKIEGCTHHRQCDDIGTVKLPRWISQHTGNKDLHFEFTSGTEFPVDLSPYKLIIHCGGCTLNEREMQYRLKCAEDQGVPITNYGTAIAHLKGVLERSLIPVRRSLE